MSKNTMSGEVVHSSGWSGAADSPLLKDAGVVVGASLLMAICAHVSLPLVFSPVPLTLQTFGVLLIALLLGSRRGFAALALYLLEGASGMPVFSPAGPGGIAQIIGPTGGFLMAYPLVAFTAGWIYEHTSRRFAWAALAAFTGEVVLFAGGLGWLFVLTYSLSVAIKWGLYWFAFAEIIKILMAAGFAARWNSKLSP